MRVRRLALCVGAVFVLGTAALANASETVTRVDRGRTAAIESMPRAHAPKKKKAPRRINAG